MIEKTITYREIPIPADKESIREIIESSGFFSSDETDVAVELVEERLTKGVRSGYYFLFAECDGKIVAYTCFGPIACTAASYDLYWIAVHDDFRGSGIGKELLKRSEAIIAAQGGKRIYIETASREQYEPTRSFYLRCGYHEEAVLKDFYSPGDDKVIYAKAIFQDKAKKGH